MALTDWAENNPGISTDQLKVTVSATEQFRRFRLRIKNAKVVALLDSLSPKFRSYLTETAVRQWLKQPSGTSSLTVFALRSDSPVTDQSVKGETPPETDHEADQNLLNDLLGGFS
jgi:hypothetical protein